MYGLFFIGGILLAAIGGALLYVLLCAPASEHTETLQPFAILPVPDAKPSTKAFLQHYASQIAWMDESILRCVLLVYLPEETETGTLCSEMAREYDFYTAMSLPEAQKLLETRTAKAAETERF